MSKKETKLLENLIKIKKKSVKLVKALTFNVLNIMVFGLYIWKQNNKEKGEEIWKFEENHLRNIVYRF
jgi:hypothetical protein